MNHRIDTNIPSTEYVKMRNRLKNNSINYIGLSIDFSSKTVYIICANKMEAMIIRLKGAEQYLREKGIYE